MNSAGGRLWMQNRTAVKATLIVSGLLVAVFALLMGYHEVEVDGTQCGDAYSNALHPDIQRATASLTGDHVDEQLVASCADARTSRQIVVFAAIQIGLIAAAVGMLIRNDPAAPLPADRRVRWAYLMLRSTAVLLPAALLFPAVQHLVQLPVEPEQEIEFDEVSGRYQQPVSACDLFTADQLRTIPGSDVAVTTRMKGHWCDLEWEADGQRIRMAVGATTYVDSRDANGEIAAQGHDSFCEANDRLDNEVCASDAQQGTGDDDSPWWQRRLEARDSNRIITVNLKSLDREALDDQLVRRAGDLVRERIER